MPRYEDEKNERIDEAYRIVSSYGEVLSRGTDGLARKISWLPCSILKIRIALCTCIEDKYKKMGNKLLQKDFDAIYNGVMGLNYFFRDDDVDRLNAIEKKPGDSWTKEEFHFFKEFLLRTSSDAEISEFQSFVNEMMGKRTYDDYIFSPYIESVEKK